MPTTTRVWRLAREVTGMIGPKHFELRTEEVKAPEELADGEVLCEVRWLSFDPAQRTWVTKGSYMTPVRPGDVMQAGGLVEVVASRHARYAPGDMLSGLCGWRERFVLTPDAAGTQPQFQLKRWRQPPGTPLELSQSILGTTGLTAFFGLEKIGRVKQGDTVLISGAAGATGSAAGQFARLMGAKRVVGIAGGEAKCRYLVDELKFDAAVDYKNPAGGSLKAALRAALPRGVDVYFDNVGGEALEAAMLLMRKKGRIVLCGGISQYNPDSAEDVQGPKTYLSLIGSQSSMEGFLVFEFAKEYPRAIQQITKWVMEGKVVQKHDVRTGFEKIPSTLQALYTSQNFGKLLVHLPRQGSAKL